MEMAREGRRILVLWVAAMVVGALLAAAVQLAFLPILDELVRMYATYFNALHWDSLAVRVGITLASAAAAAAPPAIVLGRRLHPVEIPWITASALAAVVVFLVGSTELTRYLLGGPAAQTSPVLYPLISGVLAGGLAGIAQALVLRQYVGGAAWWIAASIFGYAIAGLVTSLVDWQTDGAGSRVTTSVDFFMESTAGSLVWPLIVGLVTGWTLVRLLGESNREPTEAAI